MSHLRTTWLALCAFLLPGGALAASFPGDAGVGERSRQADRIVVAQVLERRVEQGEGTPPRLWTRTSLGVREYLKGDGPRTLELVQLGGRSGAWSSGVVGDASFEAGETALVFLRCRQPEAARCTLVGLGLGKVLVRSVEGKLQAWVPEPERAEPVARPFEAVVDEIRRALRGELTAAPAVTPAVTPGVAPDRPSAATVMGEPAPALAPSGSRVFTPKVPVPTGQPRAGGAR